MFIARIGPVNLGIALSEKLDTKQKLIKSEELVI